MKLSPIISHIRKNCPTFKKRVGGWVEWSDEPFIANMKFKALPACYVLPATDDVGAQEMTGPDYYQSVTRHIKIIVIIAKNRDHTGMSAYDDLEDIRQELFKAIVTYSPENKWDRLEYDSDDGIIVSNRAFIAQRWDFAYTDYLTSDLRGDGSETVYVDTQRPQDFKGMDIVTRTETGAEARIRVDP